MDLVFGSSIWGGVHSGGALVGRRVLGVCEKCGAVQAGVAYGFTKTEAVTVTVTVVVSLTLIDALVAPFDHAYVA